MKKITVLTLFLVFNAHLAAQEFDENFLKSLPDGIKSDLLDNVESNDDFEEPAYKSIESQTKLEKKNLEDLKKKIRS
jgi:hypothetical protein